LAVAPPARTAISRAVAPMLTPINSRLFDIVGVSLQFAVVVRRPCSTPLWAPA
jgi:hypothetical protein